MPKRLDEAAVARFARDGILFPIPVFGKEETDAHLARFQALVADRAGRLPQALNAKAHLLLPWLWDIVHDPRIVDPVEDLIGPDILCWATTFIAKNGQDGRYVSWHQDATHWKLTAPEAVTAWVAFTPSDRGNGCVRMVPGTHRIQLEHDHPHDRNNMLGRQERVVTDIAEDSVVDVVLGAGEMSIHHALTVHGSQPNASSQPRIGFAIRYIPGWVRQTDDLSNSATLVRGRDHGFFEREQAPEGDLHPAALARHRRVLRQAMTVIYGDAARPTAARAEV